MINEIHCAIFMYKYVHGLTPGIFDNKFEINQNNVYNIRNYNVFRVQRPRLNIYKKSITYRGATIWNSLPESLNILPSLIIFKEKLKLYIKRY